NRHCQPLEIVSVCRNRDRVIRVLQQRAPPHSWLSRPAWPIPLLLETHTRGPIRATCRRHAGDPRGGHFVPDQRVVLSSVRSLLLPAVLTTKFNSILRSAREARLPVPD